MALTKVSYSMLDNGSASVLDYGAVGDGAANDTQAIQDAIDSPIKNIIFPPGSYKVTNVNFRVAGKTYIFQGQAGIVGDSTASGFKAPVEITAYYQNFYDLVVSQNFNTNYAAAVWWHKYSGDAYYPQYIHIKGMVVQNCLIGILYGDTSSPVDAPVSENHITQLRSRGCERVIYMNQPNGFLTISDSTLQATPNEWDVVDPGVYNNTQAVCIEIQNGLLNVSNSFLVKNTTQDGYGIVVGLPGGTSVYPTLTISNCTPEILCGTWYVGDSGVLEVSNWQQVYWANGTGAAWLETSSTGDIYATFNNSRFDGHPSGSSNGVALNDNADAIIDFVNCRFAGQNRQTILDSATAQYWCYGGVSFKQCSGTDITGPYRITSGDNNLAAKYATPVIGDFTVSAGVGTSASIVTVVNPNFNKALEIVGALGATCTVTTGADILLDANARCGVLELTMKSAASTTQFYGQLQILYYDAAGAFLSGFSMDNGAGGVAFLQSIAGLQDWGTVRRVIPQVAGATKIAVRFIVSTYAQTWQIGGIKVY